jgi:polyphenol oxidase
MNGLPKEGVPADAPEPRAAPAESLQPTAPQPAWLEPDWPAPPGVRALITLRSGGVSTGPYGTADGRGGLNLGVACGDAAAAVNANRARLVRELPSVPRWLRQVHGARVVDAAGVGEEPVEADAAWTDQPGVVATIQMADCLPVLLADAHGRCVGVAHAGWRGLAAGVIQATARAMRAGLGDPSAPLRAYLGPAIGPDHFEVGREVAVAVQDGLPGVSLEHAFVAHGEGKFRADLYALARLALAQVQVHEVHGGGLCTVCDPVRFYSHRRDRVTGRHAALIWLDPGLQARS